ncbi:MAG: NAD-dependent epimerase/dehydratase family protein, partial [Candidatus Omnitrophica bacterium]|nr:NAD-dependent epimerase/dehydratase family protein [Candidatus Omnitrophota bacterium]
KAKQLGIKKIVCASSSSLYGERTRFPEKETDAARPASPYGATKLIVEYYSQLFSNLYGMDIVNLRYFNVYGPRQSLDDEYAVVVPKFINCLLRGESPPVYGDGKQERDFTFISNVVDANITVLAKDGLAGEIFNIGLGSPKSVNYLLDSLKSILNCDIEPRYLPPRQGDVRKTHASIEKAKKMLGWQPAVNFQDGLKIAVEWFKNNKS